MANVPTIVVIDDSAEVRALITTRLRISGSIAVVADGADGAEAIGLAYQHRPSLMLLDLSMPGMDGLEALPGVLALSPETRVVVYTGFEERGLAERARGLGAAGFIEKALPIDRLVAELLALLPPGPAPLAPASPAERPPASRRWLTLVGGRPAVDDGTSWTSDDQGVLDEHLERFREVFDEAAIGMATMTLTGGIVRANRALGSLMRCEHPDLVGLDYGRLMAGRGELLDAALEEVNNHSADLAHIEHEVPGVPGGRTVRATLAPVRDSRGQALYIFLQVQDVTAQRAAEDRLRQSEERFRLLVEVVKDYAIFMLSPEGIVSSWNAGAERSKGYRAQEIIGQHFRVFYDPEQRAQRHPEHELEIALREGRYEEEGWRVRKDGSRFWANVVITAVFNDAGTHVGFAKVTRDRTEQRRAEQESSEFGRALAEANRTLETLNARLRRAASDQAQFLAVTAHELRSPAAVLGGSAETLSGHWSELAAEERAGLLSGMKTSAGRLRRLLADLLTAARLESDTLPLHRRAIPLSGVLSDALVTVHAAHPGAEVVLGPAEDVEVLADPDRLAQAVDNLIGNALHHGAQPVRVSIEPTSRTALVRVSDSGGGVDPDMRSRLFDRFTTGDSLGGTGLGLFIVRELARAHGGDAYYEPGSDARPAGSFVISVPLARSSPPADALKSEA